jgi:hypothetical protein
MPKMYRTMFEDAGQPRVGGSFCELGVRPPGRVTASGKPSVADVDVDSGGNTILNGKGMSVFRSLGDLPQMPARLVPIHLAPKVRGAVGPSGTRIWSMGSGAFTAVAISSTLSLYTLGGRHGTICPSTPMPIATLQQELAATQGLWGIDEP